MQDLKVYQRSKNSYAKVVKVTRSFPKEGWHLGDQSRRAANSIHSNIAEGFGRTVPEFCNYLTRSLGSNNELLSHIEDALASGYISKDICRDLQSEYTILGKQLYRLRERWRMQ